MNTRSYAAKIMVFKLKKSDWNNIQKFTLIMLPSMGAEHMKMENVGRDTC